MAVHAQYPSNILLLNRNLQENKNILHNNDFSLQGDGYQSHMIFNNNEVVVNPRKRIREIAATTTTTTTTTTNMIDLSQQQHNNLVSTGLRLSFGDQNRQRQQQQQQEQHQQIQQLVYVSKDFALQLKQQSDQLNYFLHAQGEQLRRTLADKRQRHYHTLLTSVEQVAVSRLREKEAAIQKAGKINTELEAQFIQLSNEAQIWRLKAQAQEAQALSFQAQINQAINNVSSAQQHDKEGMVLKCAGGEVVAQDSESAYIDPVSERRSESASCKMCRSRAACVVLLPCRHMCVCVGCDDDVLACPVCFIQRSASIEVYFS